MKHFYRRIQIRLWNNTKSANNSLVLDTCPNNQKGLIALSMTLKGSKNLAVAKDEFQITVHNLNYDYLLHIINNELYCIEILTGYTTSGLHSIYKGYVFYIDNKMIMRDKTTEANIYCTTYLIGNYSQRGMNLTLKAGINMYTAINYLMYKNGIPNSKISENFKNIYMNTETTYDGRNFSDVLKQLENQNKNLQVSNDCSQNGSIASFYSNEDVPRKYNLDIRALKDYPTLSKEGLTIQVIPNMNYKPYDVIMVPQAIINMAVNDKSEAYTQMIYLDSTYQNDQDVKKQQLGAYIVWKVTYNLTNTDGEHQLTLLCKSYSMYRSATDAEWVAKTGKVVDL